MSIFVIKIIAVLTMAIDHIGAFLLPDYYPLRMIGRLSFPLFAWLIANGAVYTRSMAKYMQRLVFLGIISQVPFMLLHRSHNPNSWEINIFLTLFLGLLGIYAIQRLQTNGLKVIAVGVLAIAGELFCGGFSYGAYGVLTIVGFYFFKDSFTHTLLLQVVLTALFYVPRIIMSDSSLEMQYMNHSMNLIQPLALLSLIFIYYYNSKQGPKMQWFFYWFYPLHLAAIYAIAMIFNIETR
jgi:hypothetical protein